MGRHLSGWILGALLVALGGLACTREVVPGSTFEAEVRDFATGEPIAGAVVSVIEGEQAQEVAVSDIRGRFALEGSFSEVLTLEIESAGREILRRTFRLVPGEERAVDLFMVPAGASLPDDTILFERGGTIWRVDPAGLEAENLTADLDGVQSSPTWNGDRTQFAFIQRIPGRSQVVIRHRDGAEARFIAEVPDSISQLRWGPGGRAMVFVYAARTPRGQFAELRQMDVFSGVHKDLVGGREERDPTWSRDGRFIAWARLLPGRTWEIWTAGADGGASRAILPSYNAREPTWSPDGKRLAFASNREGAYNLYEMAIEAPRPRRLTSVPPGGFARRPLYSPLGDELLFESNVHRGALQAVVNLYALNMRTGRVREVVDDAHEASW